MNMRMGTDGIERLVVDTSRDRYFVTDRDGIERETDQAGFISMEQQCGFRPKPGCGPMATGGFGSGDRGGRIEHWFDGPAKIVDTHTGEETAAISCTVAYDRTRELNGGDKRRRYFAQRA